MKQLTLLLTLLLSSQILLAQSIKGIITDQETGEGLPFANVILVQDGVQKAGTTTDLDGNYKLKGMETGTYVIKAVYVGYQDEVKEIIYFQNENEEVFVNLEMGSRIIYCDFGIRNYKTPLINLKNPTSGQTIRSEDISRFPF